MTGDPLLDLAIAFAGTVLMIGLSYALGAFRGVPVEAATAAERLAFDEPDFRPADWLVSEDGRAAIAMAKSGAEYAVIFAVGDGLATRRLKAGSKPVLRDGRAVTLLLGEVSKRRVALVAPDDAAAAAWTGRLSHPPLF